VFGIRFVSFRIEVDNNGAKWYITNLHVDDNDYLSVANDSLSVNCFQDGINQTFPVYLINDNRSYLICQATNPAPTTKEAAIFICFVIVAVVTFLFVGYLVFAFVCPETDLVSFIYNYFQVHLSEISF
jgi:hypothetical protein